MPGGAHEPLNTLQVTTPDAARATLDAHRVAFTGVGLEGIWPRIIALVVQPGVEFDHAQVIDYESEKAKSLSAMVEDYATLLFEAHSTDYQTPACATPTGSRSFRDFESRPGVDFRAA